MAFSFDLSEKLKEMLPKLAKRDKALTMQVNKKIKEITSSDEYTIEHYKNLRNDLSDQKRVHVGGSFVLLFRVFKKEKFILFDRLEHHDTAYKK